VFLLQTYQNSSTLELFIKFLQQACQNQQHFSNNLAIHHMKRQTTEGDART